MVKSPSNCLIQFLYIFFCFICFERFSPIKYRLSRITASLITCVVKGVITSACVIRSAAKLRFACLFNFNSNSFAKKMANYDIQLQKIFPDFCFRFLISIDPFFRLELIHKKVESILNFQRALAYLFCVFSSKDEIVSKK